MARNHTDEAAFGNRQSARGKQRQNIRSFDCAQDGNGKGVEYGGHGGVGGTQAAELLAETQAAEPRSREASELNCEKSENRLLASGYQLPAKNSRTPKELPASS